jgi:hypothetical protein
MRFLRYFIGGFEALLALMALMGFGAGLIVFVHLCIQMKTPHRSLSDPHI